MVTSYEQASLHYTFHITLGVSFHGPGSMTPRTFRSAAQIPTLEVSEPLLTALSSLCYRDI